MELRSFGSERSYYRAQKRTRDRRRTDRNYFKPLEMVRIGGYLAQILYRPSTIICHGTRNSNEGTTLSLEIVHQFDDAISIPEVVCTDLFPEGEGVVKWDFTKRSRSWIGRFDLLYSNSLDHSYDPHNTLRIWFNQLKPGGWMALKWSPNHITTSGGDCFGAYLYEYMELLEMYGDLKDLLYIEDGVVVLMARTKEDL